MKKYLINLYGKNIEILQDEDGKFIKPELAKYYEQYGTAVKPSYEPIIVARKPFKTSVVENIMQYGVGGINIDECRVPAEQGEYDIRHYIKEDCFQNKKPKESKFQVEPQPIGRFPSNVIHDGSEETIKDMPNADRPNGSITKQYKMNNQVYGDYGHCNTWNAYQDSGSASRYFYCAKASKKDRDEGLDMFDSKFTASAEFRPNHMEKALNGENGNPYGRWTPVKNIHPTVKPVELMQYLVRLVTPKNGTILDCFMGSGSTGKAVMFENGERNSNYKFIGIELTEEYLPICEARIEYAINKYEYDFKQELEEAKKDGQLNIFEVGDINER